VPDWSGPSPPREILDRGTAPLQEARAAPRYNRCMKLRRVAVVIFLVLCGWAVLGQSPRTAGKAARAARPASASKVAGVSISSPKEMFGFNIGDDYSVANYSQLTAYWKKLAAQSNRMKLVDIGPTAEGRRQYLAIVSSPANLAKLDRYREISRRLALAEGVREPQARALAREGRAVVWIDGGLHSTETVGSQQLIETVYQMVSQSDEETLRLLDNTIQLYTIANPDGMELVANSYMRESDPLKRSLSNLPTLYHKYAGHDDNRDFYLSNLPETTNMNRVMFREWFPQIVYDHHQTGPSGTVIFMPPFRDPFNYNLDPLIPLGVEAIGTAMHARLVAEGKGGSTMRSGSTYSTWWNGGLRTISYFHNSIGLLTEIIGNPAPIRIPLVPERQLPQGDEPMPVAPQEWHYRQSIEYELSNNRAVLDYAARNRETLLLNIWRMGRNSIDRGSRDNWTVTPKRIEALRGSAPKDTPLNNLPTELYTRVLHAAENRDPRGYVLPASQADFATATEFVNALIKNGVAVLRATREFEAAGKRYPAGSYVVKTAQAFRPHVLDMFEPQDHPNDVRYPGGPPVPPYDITGWTLALQMGVEFDRILEGFDGPFEKIADVLPPPRLRVSADPPGGYRIDHRVNNSFIIMNRLLKAGCEVYWLRPAGEVWTPENPVCQAAVDQAAALGVPVTGMERKPTGAATQIERVRIGLVDLYGGLAPSGWIRRIFEQFEFPYEVVYPQMLDAGGLSARFDVLVFPDGAYRRGQQGAEIDPRSIPEAFRGMLGRITEQRTLPELRKFVEAGGTVVAIGSSTALAESLGVPVANHLTENGRALSREKFYIPGSVLKTRVDPESPLAYGMPREAYVFFDNSPVFEARADSVKRVAWYEGAAPLASGWAWGQQHLAGGIAAAVASAGRGKVILLGPEVAFRGQPHGTFKLLFNALFLGSARDARLGE
jgi:hypothetical protein